MDMENKKGKEKMATNYQSLLEMWRNEKKKREEAEKKVGEFKAELARAKEDHQYDNLVHQKELESLRNPLNKLRGKGL